MGKGRGSHLHTARGNWLTARVEVPVTPENVPHALVCVCLTASVCRNTAVYGRAHRSGLNTTAGSSPPSSGAPATPELYMYLEVYNIYIYIFTYTYIIYTYITYTYIIYIIARQPDKG